jgi:general stress protein 26
MSDSSPVVALAVTPPSDAGSMLGTRVSAAPAPQPPVEHLHGLDALPRVVEALARFEPAVLLTTDGRGAVYAPPAAGEAVGRRFWLLADARTAIDWEATRGGALTLSFQSRDERVYLQMTGAAQLVTEPGVAATIWRQSFARWFPGGPDDPRLLLVLFTATTAEYFAIESGRVSPLLNN